MLQRTYNRTLRHIITLVSDKLSIIKQKGTCSEIVLQGNSIPIQILEIQNL